MSVSLNGSMAMIIRCSKHPFALFSFEGLLDFNTACGQILDKIMEYSSNSEPLSSKVPGWKVMQIDAALDIPIKNMENYSDAESGGKKNKETISFNWLGVVKVKHLNQLYQIYNKILPSKGHCLRIENRLSFKSPQPNMAMLLDNFTSRHKINNH